MDIFSRQIVGWRVEEREADHLAVDMFETAIALHGVPRVVHADYAEENAKPRDPSCAHASRGIGVLSSA
jgi:transposase InsO family protein